jgi:hypothetical protein
VNVDFDRHYSTNGYKPRLTKEIDLSEALESISSFDLSIVSPIDVMLISFWREKMQERNLDKFLVQRESGVVRGALFGVMSGDMSKKADASKAKRVTPRAR